MTNVIPIDVARARKITAEAALTEMELAKARREYVAIEEVEKVWTDVLGAVRAKLLVMPTTLAAILAPETETKICQQVIENNVHEVLTELATYNPKEPKPSGQENYSIIKIRNINRLLGIIEPRNEYQNEENTLVQEPRRAVQPPWPTA